MSQFLSPPLVQAQPCKVWKAEYAFIDDLSIGEISIETFGVFDSKNNKEHTLLHKTANKIHISTKESVVRKQLLFSSGDHFQAVKLSDSERLLRSNRYIKDASIVPYEICNNHVNIKVITHDNWSLTPSLSFDYSNSSTKTGIEIQEQNLFGFGKDFKVLFKSDSDRTTRIVRYIDPQFLGSRKRLSTLIQNNSDGNGYAFDFSLPFYDIDSKTSWAIKSSKLELHTDLYDQGNVVETFSKEKNSHSASYGWLVAKNKRQVSRFKVGWQYNKFQYENIENNTEEMPIIPSVVESYPWLEYQVRNDKFTKKTNFKSMGRIEDVQLGSHITTGIGFLHKSFNSDNNYVKLASSYSKGYKFDDDLFFIKLKGASYLGSGSLKGETIDLRADWYSFKNKSSNFQVSGRFSASSNLKYGEQLSLGGSKNIKDEEILRGYPFAYQTGDKLALVSIEKRFHFNWYPLHLAKFGAVAFTDIGSAWGGDTDPKVLADAGIGLRIIPTRSSKGNLIQLDLAFPLVDKNKADRYQLLIKTSRSF